MKNLLYILLFLFAFSNCKHETQFSDCLNDKIEAFKSDPNAIEIVKITTSDRTLYWFRDNIADAGEPLYEADCSVFCVTDLFGITDIPCNNDIYEVQQEKIWQK
jgi:hypothetical protein